MKNKLAASMHAVESRDGRIRWSQLVPTQEEDRLKLCMEVGIFAA